MKLSLWSKSFNNLFQNSKRIRKTTFKSNFRFNNLSLGTGCLVSENSCQKLLNFSEIFEEEDEDEGR
jgi:hypothetical protein